MTWNASKPAIGNTISADIPDLAENFLVLGPYRHLWIPAELMTPTTTNGALLSSDEMSTNDVQVEHLAFDPTTQEHACYSFVMPESYNVGTIKAKFYWVSHVDVSSGDVIWGIEAGSYADGDSLDADWDSSAQVVTDTATAGDALHITDATSAITIGGSTAKGEMINIKVYRDADAGGDTINAHDCFLMGVLLEITCNVALASW